MQFSAEISKPKRWSRAVFLAALLLLGIFSTADHPKLRVLADSDTVMKDTARKLADRIAAIPGLHGPLCLDWHPDEKWSESEGARWQDTLRDAFDRRALQMSDDATAAPLAVYASETPTQVVLTAKTHVGDRDEVRIVSIPRASLPPAELPVAPVRLERQLLYESADRILDATALPSNSEGGLAILLYKNFEATVLRIDAKGEIRQTIPLNAASLKPTRNPHGEIAPRGNLIIVQFWGVVCDFSWESSTEAKCRPEKTPSSGKSAWRMDTVLTSPCDDTNWTMAQSGADPTAREVLQLIPDGATQGSTAAVLSEFPGPVLNVNGEQVPNGALVVVRNLRTGNYEVYKITLVCGG